MPEEVPNRLPALLWLAIQHGWSTMTQPDASFCAEHCHIDGSHHPACPSQPKMSRDEWEAWRAKRRTPTLSDWPADVPIPATPYEDAFAIKLQEARAEERERAARDIEAYAARVKNWPNVSSYALTVLAEAAKIVRAEQ